MLDSGLTQVLIFASFLSDYTQPGRHFCNVTSLAPRARRKTCPIGLDPVAPAGGNRQQGYHRFAALLPPLCGSATARPGAHAPRSRALLPSPRQRLPARGYDVATAECHDVVPVNCVRMNMTT